MKTTKSTDYPQQMGNGLKSCKQKHTSPLINTPLLGTSLFLLLFTYIKSLNM